MKRTKAPFLLRFVQWTFPRLERIAPSLAGRIFVRIFFTPLNYAVPEKEKHIRAKAKRFSLCYKNKRIQGYRWGDGPPVVVLHGWAGRASQFRKFIPALNEAGFSVIGIDGPAHGESGGISTDIIEFEEVLKMLWQETGTPRAVIAHSFGGSAVLYAAMNGLPVPKLINIASPTIGDDIIQTYLTTIGGSWKTGNYFKRWILNKAGKPFDEFTSIHFVRHLEQKISLLLVHDTDDEEVPLRQALELQKVYPEAALYQTTGLGHTRILKDSTVIAQCVTFIQKGRL